MMFSGIYTSNYSINHDPMGSHLMASDGNRIERYHYSSSLEEKMSIKLKDPEFSKIISISFDTHLLPEIKKLPNADKLMKEWEACLIQYASLLGTNIDYMHSLFLTRIINPEVNTFTGQHPLQCYSFFFDIAESQESKKSTDSAENRRVVILSTSSGGGHIVTAEAIQEFMETQGYKVIILDQDELCKEIDPLILGGFTYKGSSITMSEVYTRVLQQDNNVKIANELWRQGDEIRKYQPNCQMIRLIEKIREINPTMIFSVATHHEEHASLPNRLGIPLKFIHTDYGFNNALLPIADKVHHRLIKFWVNTDESEILQLDQGIQQGLKNNLPNTEPPEGYENMLLTLKEEEVIQVSGFPLRSTFLRETNSLVLNDLKSQLGIQHDNKVITISMGKFGIADHILKYVKSMVDPQNTFDEPIELVVVCGKNDELKEILEQELMKMDKHHQITVHLEGFLDKQQMADYYKVTDVLLSKPGGATTAEAEEMGVFLLCPTSHTWEKPNLNHILRSNAGDKLRSKDTIVEQINDFLRRDRTAIPRPLNWKKRIKELTEPVVINAQHDVNVPSFAHQIVEYKQGSTKYVIPSVKGTKGILGWGWNGVVRTSMLNPNVAIKKTMPNCSPDALAHEFEIGSILDHPHIVKVGNLYKKVDSKGNVMRQKLELELVSSKSVYQMKQSGAKFQEQTLIYLLTQTKECSLYLFDKKVVWEDLHAGNLMVDENGVKFIDLGKWHQVEDPKRRAAELLINAEGLVNVLTSLWPHSFTAVDSRQFVNDDTENLKEGMENYFNAVLAQVIPV